VRIKELLLYAVAVEVGAATSLGLFFGEVSQFFFTGLPNPEKWVLGKAW